MGQGLARIKTIRDFELNEKVVFLRLDLNVPLKNGQITDDNRIRESLQTIKYAFEKKAKLIVASHLGRPKNKDDVQFSLMPVAQRLTELLGGEVILMEEPNSEAIKPLLIGLKPPQMILLENLRFIPGEVENSEVFAKELASFCDIYINDAFGACHRAHATIDAMPRMMAQKGIGFLIEKEVQFLDRLTEAPTAPFVAVMGGSKVSDKIGLIEKLIDVVDTFVIGGAMAYTFLQARSVKVGSSKVETDRLNFCREIMARLEGRGKSLFLPVDHKVSRTFEGDIVQVTPDVAIPDGYLGLDIGPQTIKNFSQVLRSAGTIFWNGPMGVFENPKFSEGSFKVAEAIADSRALKVVGGGDSAAAAEASGFASKMDHISTGGGASLEYLQGDRLPGLEALRARKI